VFENRVLRRIFGPRKNKIIGGWRKLHNEVEITRACSRYGEKRNACRVFCGKTRRKQIIRKIYV
jgi:hypothetical protein